MGRTSDKVMSFSFQRNLDRHMRWAMRYVRINEAFDDFLLECRDETRMALRMAYRDEGANGDLPLSQKERS